LNKDEGVRAVRELRHAVDAGRIDIETAYSEFEKLTYALSNVPKEAERTLNSFVNDIERIRFTLLPDNQPAAVSEVLTQAEEFIDGLP
jgi:hypothetical protein